jgi:PAS domain S-box-containing protein
MLLFAALPAHVAAELQSGIPASMVLCWFVSNCSEALIGAICIRRQLEGPVRFDSFQHVIIFVAYGVFLAPFLSSFLDSIFVTLNRWGEGNFWELWRMRFFSNVLATLVVVPLIITWSNRGIAHHRSTSLGSYVESALLMFGLLAVSIVVFSSQKIGSGTTPVLLYAPLPFLLWAAVRFGPRGTSAALLVLVFLAIWGAIHGQGPFVASSPEENALSVQLFLIVVSIPLLFLAAVIEERGQTEEALRQNEERLQLALSAGQMGTWEWQIPGNKITWSSETKRIFGLSDFKGEITLESFSSLLHSADREAVLQAITRAIKKGSPYEMEFRILRPDRKIQWVMAKGEAHYDKASQPVRMLGVNMDITDRKQAEESLREEAALCESEARLRQLADAMPQIVWGAGPDGHLDYYNRRWYEQTGAKQGETGDASWLSIHHPDDRQRCLDLWYESVQTGKPFQIEHRLLFQETGTYRWHLGRALAARDGAGNIVRWCGTCTDIDDQKKAEQALREMREKLEQRVAERTAELSRTNTALREEIAERKRTTEALRRSEERFAKAFRSSPDAMAISRRADGCLLDVNDKWESLFGYSRAKIVGCSMLDLDMYASDKDRQAFHKLIDEGYVRNLEVDLRNSVGEVRQAIVASELVTMGTESCFIITIRDITEQRRAESEAQQQRQQLTHLTRAAVLGELSGALAHELNQPLTAILSNAQAAQRFLSKESVNLADIREILTDIVQEDKRAAEVIRRLRALLTKGKMQFLPLELKDVVNDALELARSDLIARNVAVTKSLTPDLPTVHGDRVQLQQVLLNLILNACEAMAATEPADRKLNVVTKTGADHSAQVCISDRGSGIPTDILYRLFEPFFTTKAHGLGLGLSISRSIMAAHSGHIWAENNPDRGATFCLAFPAQCGEHS